MTQIIFSYALRAVSIIQRIANHKVHDAVKRQLLIQPEGLWSRFITFRVFSSRSNISNKNPENPENLRPIKS